MDEDPRSARIDVDLRGTADAVIDQKPGTAARALARSSVGRVLAAEAHYVRPGRAMHKLCGPHFITVDLEVRSREDLAAFATAVEPKGFVLYAGKVRRKFLVNVGAKSTRPSMSPEQTIWALLEVVESLPPRARRLWRQADSRTFSVGYDGGDFVTLLYERPVGSGRWYPGGRRKAEPCETSFTPELLRAVANVKGTIGTTIYPPMRRAPSRGSKRGSAGAAKGPAQPAAAADGRVGRVAASRTRG